MMATPTWEPAHAATASCAACSASSTASARAGGGRDGQGGRRAGPFGNGSPSNGRPRSPGKAALFSVVLSALAADVATTITAKKQRRGFFMTCLSMLQSRLRRDSKQPIGVVDENLLTSG